MGVSSLGQDIPHRKVRLLIDWDRVAERCKRKGIPNPPRPNPKYSTMTEAYRRDDNYRSGYDAWYARYVQKSEQKPLKIEPREIKIPAPIKRVEVSKKVARNLTKKDALKKQKMSPYTRVDKRRKKT